MADVGVVYTLDAITFNSGIDPFDGTDKYYITEIRGLEAPALRTPTDAVPLGDGNLIHDYWYGATHIEIEGIILVGSTSIEDDIVVIRNNMTDALKAALNAILRADGTFAFTPQGGSPQSLTVRYEVGFQTTHTDSYHSLQFSFGLIAGTPYS